MTTSISFLDLPPEVRVKIYEAAIPDQVIIKKHSADLVANHEILTSSRNDVLPRFIFAHRLIMRECLPLFWTRIIFDTTDFELQIDDTCTTNNHDHQQRRRRFIFTSPQCLSMIQHVKTLATFTSEAGIFTTATATATDIDTPTPTLSPVPDSKFSNLKSITLTIPPSEIQERHLRRLYIALRHGKHDPITGEQIAAYTLDLLLNEWLQAWLQTQTRTQTQMQHPSTSHTSRITALAAQYAVSIAVPPQSIEQSWLYAPQYGVVHEITQYATMHAKASYLWTATNNKTNLNLNSDSNMDSDLDLGSDTDMDMAMSLRLTCSFDDLHKINGPVMADDHDAYFLGTPLPGTDGEHVYPKMYCGPEHILARKRRGVLQVLMHKEMSRRGLAPDLDTQRYNTRGETRDR